MAKDFIITVLMAIILSAFIVLSGCQSDGLPTGKKMETGQVTTPPAGWVDWQNRTKKNEVDN